MSRRVKASVLPFHDVFDALYAEHDTIQPALYWLERAAEDLERGRSVPEGFQAWVVEFLRQYADQLHHAKEERVLFPAIARTCPGQFDDALRTLSVEHVTFRDFARSLADCDLAQAPDRERFVEVARQYVGALRSHINREHHQLFGKVRHQLSAAEHAELARACAQAEQETGVADEAQRLARLVHGWSSRFPPAAG